MPSNNQLNLSVGMAVAGERDVKATLNRISGAFRDAKKDIETAGSSRLTDQFEGLGEALGKLSSIGGEAGRAVGEIVGSFSKLASGATGAVAGVTLMVTALAGLTHHAAEAAKQIEEGAQRAGTNIEAYQGLAFAFSQTGVGADGMEKALARISMAQEEAEHSAEKYDEAARIVQRANEQMRESSENLSMELRHLNEDLGDTLSKGFRDTAQERLRVVQESNKAIAREQQQAAIEEARNPARSGLIAADAARRQAQMEQDRNDRLSEIARAAAQRRDDEVRAANKRRQRLMEEHYQRLQQMRRKEQQELEEAADKAARSVDKFTRNGIQILDNGKARDTVAVMKDAAKAVAAIENPADRAAKAVELFDRRFGTQLVPVLSKGSAAIDAFIDEANKLGIVLSEPEIETGKKFAEGFDKMALLIERTFDRIGLKFAPTFKKLVDAVSDAVAKAQPALLKLADYAATFLQPAITAISGGVRAIGDIIAKAGELAHGYFARIADAINAAFGTKVTTAQVAKFAALITGATAAVAGLLLLLGTGPAGWITVLALVGAAIVELGDQIKEWWHDNAPQWLQALIALLGKLAAFVGGAVLEGFELWFKSLLAGLKAISDAIQFVYDKLKKLADLWGSVAGGGKSFAGAEADIPPAPGHATGGMIRGPGGIDKVPARLTAGEYVINKAATERHRPLLDAINYGKGFNLGGLVERLGNFITPGPALAFAGGGEVPALRSGGKTPINLHLGGHVFSMHADDHVAGALVRVAAGKQQSSGGVKPSWYGGRAGG